MNIMDYVKNPKLHFYSYVYRHFGEKLSDKAALKLLFYVQTGKELNLEKPVTYREKIQWLKLYDHNPMYTMMVDKYLVKDYVGKTIGVEHVIPTLGVWDDPEEIDFEALPDRFVLKCNHNSHLGLSVCKNKKTFDFDAAKQELRKGLNKDHFLWGREWAYKDVPRKIIAEQYIEDSSAKEGVLTDYKYFCFNGEAKLMYISHDIAKDPRTDFFDMDFHHLNIRMQDKNSDVIPEKPPFFEEMRNVAETLSKGIPFVRVDFYVANDNYYFGEMTFYPSRGLAAIHPEEWDVTIGNWIDLSKVSKVNSEIETTTKEKEKNGKIGGGTSRE